MNFEDLKTISKIISKKQICKIIEIPISQLQTESGDLSESQTEKIKRFLKSFGLFYHRAALEDIDVEKSSY